MQEMATRNGRCSSASRAIEGCQLAVDHSSTVGD